jgi:hypothetical protein
VVEHIISLNTLESPYKWRKLSQLEPDDFLGPVEEVILWLPACIIKRESFPFNGVLDFPSLPVAHLSEDEVNRVRTSMT